MGDGVPVEGSLYIYEPNTIAPIIFALTFAISTVWHIYQCSYYASWKLTGLYAVCALIFTVGYGLRVYGSRHYKFDEDDDDDKKSLLVFVISQILIYTAPPLLELGNYHVLGRIFYYVPHLAPFPPGKVLATFGALSFLVEGLNALGIALRSNPTASTDRQAIGSHLTLAGLVLQLVVIAVFLGLAWVFHKRCRGAGLSARHKAISAPLLTLYISTALIIIRCVYRLLEEVTGNTAVDFRNPEALKELSPALRYEWYLYVFEAVPMLINSFMWNLRNPQRWLPADYRVALAPDGSGEVEGSQVVVKDQRSLFVRFMDPWGWFVKKEKSEKQPFMKLNDYTGYDPQVHSRPQDASPPLYANQPQDYAYPQSYSGPQDGFPAPDYAHPLGYGRQNYGHEQV